MIRLKLFTFFLCLFFIGFNSYSQSQPNEFGQWSDIIEFDVVPVAIANLPDGRLVTWSSKYHDNFDMGDGFTYTQIFDPNGGEDGKGGVLPRMVTETYHDMFCPGINNLPDGRILVTGGSSAEKTSIYDPKTGKWSEAANLQIPKGYQGAVTLSDGSAFTIGGSWSGDATYGGRTGEVWTEATGWTLRPGLPGELLWNQNDFAGEAEGEYRLDNHAWLWTAPNGKIFHAGPGEEMHWIDVNAVDANNDLGSYETIGQRGQDHMSMNGNAVMFDIGKILKVGGSASYSSNTPSNDQSYVIDINNENAVSVTPTTNNMAHSRIYVTSVVLPNGEVLILGGMDHAEVFSDDNAHLSAEMFNPEDNSFRTLASMQVPRTYHSAGILLKDGRVFMGGGGLCGNCEVNHPDAEIYSPPYLFDDQGELAERPTLNAPDKAFYGRSLPVNATPGMSGFSLMRMSSATHSINNEQRRVPVEFTENNGAYILDLTELDGNVLIPGYYMLFAINEDGVPSIAETVLVGAPDPIINGDNLLVEFDFFEGSGAFVTDGSGMDNHGTIIERDDDGQVVALSKEYWTTEGLHGNALRMDGYEHRSNTILEIPSSPSLGGITNKITVMAWVNRDTESVVPEDRNRIPNVAIFAHDYQRSFFMGYHGAEFKAEFWTDNDGHFNGYTGAFYKPGEWEHFVTTYDGNTAKVYVNGEPIHEALVSGNLLINADGNLTNNTFTLSGFYDSRTIHEPDELPDYANDSGISDELDGRMDKFKLYDTALSEAEIIRIYNDERKIVRNEDPCDDVSLAVETNGKRNSDVQEITVREGDTLGFFLNLEDVDFDFDDYTVTYEEDNTPIDAVIENISSNQAGLYKVNYTLKEQVLASDLTVESFSSEENRDLPFPYTGLEDGKATNAIDNNSGTFWHSRWSKDFLNPPTDPPKHPHEIVLDLGEESNVYGLEYLPRQDQYDLNGTIADYAIYVSNSTEEWGQAVISSDPLHPLLSGGDPLSVGDVWEYTIDQENVSFTEKLGRYVKLVALSEGGSKEERDHASAAEIRININKHTYCTKELQVHVHVPKTYTYDDGWSSEGDPSGVSTRFDDIIIEEGVNAVIATDTSVDNLVIEPGAALTIETNKILSFSTITLNSTSTSYASLIDKGWVAGDVIYNRHVNKMGTAELGGGNDLISSPVTGLLFNKSFVDANPDLPEHPTNPGIFAFAPFNISNNKYENFNIGTDRSGSIPINSGRGYRAATEFGGQLLFRGQITRNKVNVSISDDAAGYAWNLIGNPYPSYLDFEMFFEKNKDQFDSRGAYQAIYGYTGVSGGWIEWNQATIEDPNFNTSIAPGQGFFVKAKPGGGEVSFEPEMRIAGSSDDFIAGRPSKNLALSKLKLSRTSGAVSTSIYFIEGTTKGLDPGYDAAGYDATTVDFSLFTNLVEDHTGLDIAIQSLPYEDYNDVIVPLGMKAKAGAKLRIGIDELSTLPENINVYLEDTQNNTLTLLNADDFTFTPTEDINGAGRFNVHYSSRALSIADLDANDNLRIFTTETPKNVVISGQLSSATTAHLYDIQGRLVLSQKLNPSTTENTMDISTITTGVYVVKLNNDHQIKTQKVIIK